MQSHKTSTRVAIPTGDTPSSPIDTPATSLVDSLTDPIDTTPDPVSSTDTLTSLADAIEYTLASPADTTVSNPVCPATCLEASEMSENMTLLLATL